MAGHIQTSKATDWCTPPEIYLPVQKFFGEIDLDPCSNPKSGVPAKKRYMLELGQDGLKAEWKGRVYCNPPYGRGLKDWIEKADYEADTVDHASEVILLIPAAVGTKNWQETIFRYANGICFLKGRIKFQGATASAPMACALVYFGG